MHIDALSVGEIQANCYIVSSLITKNAILIDPGDESAKIKAFLDRKKLSAQLIVHTHGHIDHIQADNDFNLPVYAHKLEVDLLKNPEKNLSNLLSRPFSVNARIKPLDDLEYIRLDDLSLQALHTPGHTPGGICLKSDNVIFTGDTLFAGSIGRTDFPGASYAQLIQSIRQRLLGFPEATVIYPGHGPQSTIGKEKKLNPFLVDHEDETPPACAI